MSDKPIVLPCPFCGAVDTEGRYIEQKFYAPDDQHQERAKYKFVYFRFCNSCGAHGPQGDRSEDDKELWNRRASPLPKAETQPVAWRAWSKPVPGRKWPSDQWVYWDEEPTTIQDDPEYERFQALYSSPPLSTGATGEGWRPIETAPKTGEHILVAEFNPERIGFGFCGGKKQSMMTVVHWWDNPGEEGWYASVDSQGEYPFPATHWKPLEELKA